MLLLCSFSLPSSLEIKLMGMNRIVPKKEKTLRKLTGLFLCCQKKKGI
jgi:hypothetical protein